MTMLTVFEAAARHVSFKFAAQELNVTPGAVSRQIKHLEEEVGTPLFTRVHRGVELTAEGDALYAVLARSFGQTAEVVERLRRRGRSAAVTVGATMAFAALWLMPRFGAFWRRYPEITLNHMISDSVHDLKRPDVDLRVRYGHGVWPDETAVALFGDRIFPVCGPRYAENWPGATAADLPAMTLLRLEGVDPEWTTWEEWLQAVGVAHGALGGRRFNNYTVALQAAQDDQGVTLGWAHLVMPLLDAGRLVRVGDQEIAAPGRYYIAWSTGRDLTPQAETLKDWLLDAARAETGLA
jgi:DNA-binding transcriptional LysR family regulator